MTQRILVPLLADERDKTAIALAKNIANALKSKIVLMHVTEHGEISASLGTYFDKLTKNISDDGIATKEPILRKGNEVDEILKVLDETEVDLVILSALEESQNDFENDKRNVKLVRKTDVPVIEVKQGGVESIKTILCPVDMSENSLIALNNAIGLASLFHARLIVFSVFEPIYSTSEFIREDEKSLEQEHKQMLERFLKQIDFGNVQWKSRISSGKPAEAIRAEAISYKVDLIVMGSSGKSGISRKLLGSVTEDLISKIPGHVLAMREKDLVTLERIEKVVGR